MSKRRLQNIEAPDSRNCKEKKVDSNKTIQQKSEVTQKLKNSDWRKKHTQGTAKNN